MKTVSFTLSVIGLAVATSAFATEKPVLNVYTYDSFASKYGKPTRPAPCVCPTRVVAASPIP